jgi:hypothetical protein
MDHTNLTTEQLGAIERWENEGGKISIPPGVIPTPHDLEFTRTAGRVQPTFVFQRRKREWTENVPLFAKWSLA